MALHIKLEKLRIITILSILIHITRYYLSTSEYTLSLGLPFISIILFFPMFFYSFITRVLTAPFPLRESSSSGKLYTQTASLRAFSQFYMIE